MGIRESLLNTITSVGNGDFIRIVTSAGASSKATLANVFKSFESGLGAKSSLTTSDYIRVVGSDNNAYKQSIASVMTTMGIGKAVAYGDLASFYTDFSAMATDVKYFVTTWGNCSTALGLPAGTYKGYATKVNATLCDMTVQTYGASGTNVEYIGRVTFDSSGAVTATNWTKQPTIAEVALQDGTWYRNADLNDFTTTGFYWIADSPNAPSGWVWFALMVISREDTIRQIAFDANENMYIRVYQGSQGWREWVKQPTRGEIDALNSNLNGIKIVLLQKTVTIPAGTVSSPSETSFEFNDAPARFQGVIAYLNSFHLPYIGINGTMTWVSNVQTKTVTIKNSAPVWNNYTLFIVGFCK